jgi:hypothetical protein
VANPAVTCADVAEAGFPSSFVANPFLFIQVRTSNFFVALQFQYFLALAALLWQLSQH